MRIFVIVVAIITLLGSGTMIFFMFGGEIGSVSGSGQYHPDYTVPVTIFFIALVTLVLSPAIPRKKKPEKHMDNPPD